MLVTGGAGYIGSHACRALAEQGFHPVAVDNLVYGHERAVQWGPLEVGDIADAAFLDVLMERYRPIAVMHFAAYAYVGESMTDPAKYYMNNVVGALVLLEACRRFGVNSFVFSSTCATYGVPDIIPIDETQSQKPINPYGASKLMIERVLSDYNRAYPMRYVSLRYFNAAGASLDAAIGESHVPETHLIPLVLDAAIGERKNITIFGDDYATPDGTCVRDYVHVIDLAHAHVKALRYLLNGGDSVALNLGTGSGQSVMQIIAMAEKVTGLSVPFGRGDRRPGDPAELVANPARAQQVLGWVAKYSSLETILSSAWKWHRTKGLPNDTIAPAHIGIQHD